MRCSRPNDLGALNLRVLDLYFLMLSHYSSKPCLPYHLPYDFETLPAAVVARSCERRRLYAPRLASAQPASSPGAAVALQLFDPELAGVLPPILPHVFALLRAWLWPCAELHARPLKDQRWFRGKERSYSPVPSCGQLLPEPSVWTAGTVLRFSSFERTSRPATRRSSFSW